MKLVLLLVGVVSCQKFYKTEDDRYDTSTMSLDELRAVVQCINDRGPCNTVTASFRQYYPGIVQEVCKRCSKDHKIALCKFYKRVSEELPDELLATQQRHDPNGRNWDAYLASFSKEC